jgi:hypothetical protein
MSLVNILREVVPAVRKLGPYALLELVMPGGTILAILLYLYRRHRDACARRAQPTVDLRTAGSS